MSALGTSSKSTSDMPKLTDSCWLIIMMGSYNMFSILEMAHSTCVQIWRTIMSKYLTMISTVDSSVGSCRGECLIPRLYSACHRFGVRL
eukprot:693129-Amphidinium_carterae.1